tara:strand:+ start:1498 stop:1902 length:405 start_codon:yes stop_codon:yes gene_type:complete
MAKGIRVSELKGMSIEDLRGLSSQLKNTPSNTLKRFEAFLTGDTLTKVGDALVNIPKMIREFRKQEEREEERKFREAEKENFKITDSDKLEKLSRGEAVGLNFKNRGGLTKGGHKDYRGTGMFYGGMAKKANKK